MTGEVRPVADEICYDAIMNLQEFVKDVLVQINAAVDEAGALTSREIRFSEKDNARTIEFDIAVSAEDARGVTGKSGIKVLQFIEAGGDISKENKNSTVSRIVFGLRIAPSTKIEQEANSNAVIAHNADAHSQWSSQF